MPFPPALVLLAVMTLPLGCMAGDTAPADEEMSTDRPDFTESTDVVAVGIVQVESGFVFDSQSRAGSGSQNWTVPSALIRTGVASWLELRVGTAGFQHERDRTDGSVAVRHSGFSDVDVEAKFLLARERHLTAAFAVITALTIPTGTAGFSENSYNPGLLLCWSKSMPGGFDAGGNFNFRWTRGDSENRVAYAQTLSVEHKLPSHLSMYWELYRMAPIPGDESARWTADTGILRMLGRNAQVDIEAGHSLLARTSDRFAGAGLSVRFAPGFLRRH
jgi:hypothetical protein